MRKWNQFGLQYRLNFKFHLFVVVLAVSVFSLQVWSSSGRQLSSGHHQPDLFQARAPRVEDGYFEFSRNKHDGIFDLLEWNEVHELMPIPGRAYNRLVDFGTWVDEENDDSCLNVRAKVLVRDSLSKVVFAKANPCVVAFGKWLDPYTGRKYSSARDIQVDHLVPLKHAFMVGAYAWSSEERCLYANFMGNTYHLLPVSAQANTEKGDRTPAEYLPENESYRCAYMAHWLAVKFVWGLRMLRDEVDEIRSESQRLGCDPKLFQLNETEYASQLNYIESKKNLCSNRH